MSEEFDAVVAAVRERVTPDDEERERLRAVTERLTERTEAAADELPVETDTVLVGSTARGTWLAGDRDVDLFVQFPADLERDRLEEYGLQVGREVLPDGREEYAEHPYTVGEFEGFSVDLVPCYDVADATAIQSAVDRTPFHTAYLDERLDDDLAAEVRVAKAFLKGIGVYGADLKTRGVSGYLTELLVLEYGGFRALVEAATDWHPPVELDPADHAEATFEDPLVVIDPTDPERNVAAALSPANVARLQHYARELLADPREALFEPDEPDPLDADGVREALTARGTTPVAVVFDAPDLVDDQLWPQLRKSRHGVADELDRRGFDVFRSAAFADDRAVLFLELAVAERPAIERHDGPPVHVREHARGFYEKYADDSRTESTDPPYGPFIAEDRYVVEREREYTSAHEFLTSDALFEVALGAHVESALEDGYDVLVGDDVAELAAPFGTALARYFSPKP
ncbi:CCA tRNA nucleotidyltransferase [Halorientalis sp. IM1011]|uniref:CCA tRNA nucleotidyltransferase n=1 Tax=Halorientalis sp. IM1011 TaxID=1932360 RepID=UPI00097CC97E|nr:CCA tRNA nucleotidyltransferase [Halorientalis sp. IM1011]AQL42475.1 CCA tRNA nucleotidyltransferase [Halorientalis sp. IM1011]